MMKTLDFMRVARHTRKTKVMTPSMMKFWNELIWRLYKNMKDYESKMDERISHERGSFFDVVKSAYIMWFFGWAVGVRVALTFCCLAALLVRHLDAGYKLGFLTAWVLEGKRGV